MRKSTLIIIIILMSVSSLGIMSAQAYWLYLEAKQAAADFDSKVYNSLAKVREQLNDEEALVFVQRRIGNAFSFSTIDLFEEEGEDKVVIKIDGNDHDETIIIESDSNKRVIKSEFKKSIEWSEDSLKMEIVELENEMLSDSLKFHVLLNEKKEQLQTTLEKLAFEFAINESSLQERLQNTSIDSLLQLNFNSLGIEDDYKYEIRSKQDVLLESSNEFESKNKDKTYQTNLFEGIVRNDSAILSVYFPSKMNSIIKSIWLNLLITIILSVILLSTFAYTLYSILRQKRLAQVKSDFINNMTHEFKTPIATISLAIDNMLHPLVRKDEKEIEKFGNIIKKENERMDQQIGRVLEIARLEKQEISLRKEEVQLDSMIQDIVSLFKVNIEENQGDIILISETSDQTIIGDKMHLFNAIRNVVENGIKYSKGQFRLNIQSYLENENWVIKITDKGIGMSQKTIKHIFDRFYRKTDGNLHETKGFGIGLFYTQNIVKQHGGDISVNSRLGEGSEFKICIPLK